MSLDFLWVRYEISPSTITIVIIIIEIFVHFYALQGLDWVCVDVDYTVFFSIMQNETRQKGIHVILEIKMTFLLTENIQ